jgi:N-hydroxyarylamine O-acetyltransferase
MSEKSQLHRFDRKQRVLVIGQEAEVLDQVIDEVRRAGIDVRGMAARKASGSLTGPFDIVAIGSGVPADQRPPLELEVRFHNPAARIIRVYAPFAASQIVAAARNEDMPDVDLGAYFDRIGYDGTPRPNLDTLRALTELHPAAIPFEAIDVLLDRGIDISAEAVDAKLIERRRGGYCYEQNSLFTRVLKAIGFEVESMASHVRWMSEPGAPLPALTHRVLRVIIDGVPWLADVGFGSAVPTAPLRMDIGEPQPTRHDTYRIVRMGPQWLLQAEVEDQWRPVYSIAAEPWLEGQYEMANWYTSTHPASHFRHRLIVTRTTPGARHILADGRLTIRRPDGTTEKRLLDADQIMEALETIFLLPVEPEWRAIADRAAAAVEQERLAEAA